MTKLALIRHGPTAYTETRRIQGRADVPLSEAGRALVGSYTIPADLHGFRWLTSPLTRARETAEMIVGEDVTTDPRLMEMDWGAWEGRSLSELRTELGAAMRENEDRGWDFSPQDGETPREVFDRLRGWLRELSEEAVDTAAVTHKGVIRVITATALAWNMLGPPPLKLDWTCAHLFDIDANGEPRLLSPNIPLIAADNPMTTTTRQAG